MKETEKVIKVVNADVGIIVGRFQVHTLTDAHVKLIEDVKERHEKVIIFLGVSGISPVPSTKRNPLDYEMRQQMIEDKFGKDVVVSYIKDMKTNEAWSKQLDGRIADLTSPKQSVMLYGGRDSFILFYKGKHKTEELEPEVYVKISGTEVRDKLKNMVESSDMFRAGVIWANENQYDHAMCVIDIAIFNDDYTKILLGKRNWEAECRFFGGFVDVADNNFEMTVRREVKEEAGIEITDPVYICSRRIQDWRYRNEKDKVFTTFFAAKYMYGSITPGDDIDECKWVDINNPRPGIYSISENLVPEHEILLEELFKKLDKIKNG